MSAASERSPATGATTEDTPLIELSGVSKEYEGNGAPVTVLREVSLSIWPGEFLAIVGASGSGKSTLMNILGCLDRPSDGTYRFEGEEVGRGEEADRALLRRTAFGFVFQQYHLVAGMTAQENVEAPAVYAGQDGSSRRTRAAELLVRLGMADRLSHRRNQLSGGQQQRVSIARALMNGGRVVLADEPTGALDTKTGMEVMQLLAELSAAGHTVVVITHDRSVAALARRIVELADGEIVSDSGRDRSALVSSTAPRKSIARSSLAGISLEAFKGATRALRVNPGRTALTLLGIVVGVASVVALLAIGEGAKRAVFAQLSVFGTNRLYVMPGADDPRAPGGVLTEADVAVVRSVPNVAAAMPYLKGMVTVRRGNVDHRTTGVGVTADFPRILNWRVESGAFFAPVDEPSLATVALIGKKLKGLLFPDGVDPLRAFILVDNVPFQVIGVLAEKGALTGDTDDDDTIVFPFATASQRILGTPYLSWISVLVDDVGKAGDTVAEITTALTDKHRIKDFDVYNKAASIAAQTATMDILTSLLSMTAVISLIVGGIGVMNIMLMTVTERTSEIGIRVAVGASRGDILRQFLTEAVMLSALGGGIGLLLGWGVGLLATTTGLAVAFTTPASITAFACAVAAGLIFGFLPALRASRLDPVVALSRQ